jgi:hypothetical protein
MSQILDSLSKTAESLTDLLTSIEKYTKEMEFVINRLPLESKRIVLQSDAEYLTELLNASMNNHKSKLLVLLQEILDNIKENS